MEFGLDRYRKKVCLLALVTAGAIELISLPILGIDIGFTAGLAAGTATAVMNFNLMYLATEYALRNLRAAIIPMSTIGRLCIYGLIFFLSIKSSYAAAIGCGAGFMTDKMALFYLHVVKKVDVKSSRQVPEDVKAYYKELDKERKEREEKRVF